MKFRLLLASAVLATASISAYADTFYVSPEGAGEKTGVDAENAMGVDEFRASAAGLTNTSVVTYQFAGGVYNFEKSVKFVYGSAPTLVGNADGERTVFSAENQSPDLDFANGGGILFIRLDTKDQSATSPKEKPIKISNIDFCNLTNGKSTGSGDGVIAAIGLNNSGYVEIENCSFKNNASTCNYGGIALEAYRSTVIVRNCTFEGNKSEARGGAVFIRSNAGSKGITVFENCLFKDNEITGEMGGAVFCNSVNSTTFVDCTFAGNKAAAKGSVLYCNGVDATYARKNIFISCTIADNPCTEDAPIMVGNGGNAGQLWLMNNIIVQKQGEAREATGAVIGTIATVPVALTSGGYNYLGSVENAGEDWAQTTDVLDKDYASIFGNHTINATTGLIKPSVFVEGATSEQIKTTTSTWGLTNGVTIADRGEDVAPGAGAFTQQQVSTGIADIANDADAVKVIALGDGNYTVAGYEGAVEVYSVSGACVLTAVAPELNLSGLASGVYIVRAGKTVAKVVR